MLQISLVRLGIDQLQAKGVTWVRQPEFWTSWLVLQCPANRISEIIKKKTKKLTINADVVTGDDSPVRITFLLCFQIKACEKETDNPGCRWIKSPCTDCVFRVDKWPVWSEDCPTWRIQEFCAIKRRKITFTNPFNLLLQGRTVESRFLEPSVSRTSSSRQLEPVVVSLYSNTVILPPISRTPIIRNSRKLEPTLDSCGKNSRKNSPP